MSYRELTMIDVKEVLRRWSAGQGERKIAREAGADRKTIARYMKAAAKLGLERGGEFTDEVVHEVAVAALNVAPTFRCASTRTVQLFDVPEHAPVQPVNLMPPPFDAMSVVVVPVG